jgi:hypothetical protein
MPEMRMKLLEVASNELRTIVRNDPWLHAERDRKLEAARQQRQSRRQTTALIAAGRGTREATR